MSELSDAVSKALEEFGDVEVPEGLPTEVAEIYQAGANRLCMCCLNHLGKNSVVVISEAGTSQAYCSHRCLTDLMVIGWMSTTYDDMRQAVEFRGQS